MFRGGLDAIFGGKKEASCVVETEDKSTPTIKDLLKTIVDDLLVDKEKKCTFIQDDTVRPGVLVLINDTDWELEGTLDYELQPNDLISFTSTLHGG